MWAKAVVIGAALLGLAASTKAKPHHALISGQDNTESEAPIEDTTDVLIDANQPTYQQPTGANMQPVEQLKTSAEHVQRIRVHEGYRDKPYSDFKGYSVGYGHQIKVSDLQRYGQDTTPDSTTGWVGKNWRIDRQIAEDLLEGDCAAAEQSIKQCVTVPLSQNQFDSLVDFVFQFGGGALKSSTLVKKLNAGNYEGAAKEHLRWTQAGGVFNASVAKLSQARYDLWNLA